MLPLQEGLVYGPVRSRRLGRSLGINILPRHAKTCTFNCSYCQYGWTPAPVRDPHAVSAQWPTPDLVAREVSRHLDRFVALPDSIDRLTLAGHGEPTLHPRFAEVVETLRAVRDRLAPRLPLAILSNGSTLAVPGVAEGLGRLDERYMKLDAGNTALVRRINGTPLSVERLVADLAALRPLVVQTIFVRDRLGRIDNAGDLAVATWIAALQRIAPRLVHIYSLDRAPAWPYLQAVPRTRLDEIARRVQAAGIDAVAFG